MNFKFKAFILLLGLPILFSFTLQSTKSKKSIGIYKTYIDFFKEHDDHKLKKGAIYKNPLSEQLKIKTPDSTYTIEPGSIFGYFDGKDKYRYYYDGITSHGGYYKIKEVGQFIIYEKVINHKATRGSKLKGPVKHIYFSKEMNSPIKELNYANLTEEYKDNPEVLYVVSKIGPKCKNCYTKKTKKGYFINYEVSKYIKLKEDSLRTKF